MLSPFLADALQAQWHQSTSWDLPELPAHSCVSAFAIGVEDPKSKGIFTVTKETPYWAHKIQGKKREKTVPTDAMGYLNETTMMDTSSDSVAEGLAELSQR